MIPGVMPGMALNLWQAGFEASLTQRCHLQAHAQDVQQGLPGLPHAAET